MEVPPPVQGRSGAFFIQMALQENMDDAVLMSWFAFIVSFLNNLLTINCCPR